MSTVALQQPRSRYGFAQVARSELIKLFTLRSTYWTILITLLGAFGVTVLTDWSARHHPAGWYQGFDPTNRSLTGVAIGVLAMGVFGALAATGEYSTGTIRSTLAAAPRRPLLVVGKVAVVGLIALVVCEVLTFGCYGIGNWVLSSGGAPTASLSHAGVFRAVALSGVFLALLGLFALGIGLIVRHTAGALATYVGLTFLVPILLTQVHGHPDKFTPVPMLANSVSVVVHQPVGVAQPDVPLALSTAMLLMAVYTVASLVLGAAMIVRRDA
jgi:hypothetical protein